MGISDSLEETSPLVDLNVSSDRAKSQTRDVHILSLAFLLVFSAYGAVQNLESTVNDEGDLGTISLGILYVSFMVFSFFASLVVRKLGSKYSLLLGTTGYWLFTAANLKPNWYTMIPASVYMGFCASIIWVGQGTYLTSTARSHARDCNIHEGTVIGNFNGEFWGIYATHQIIGNLLALFLLKDGKEGDSAGSSGATVLFFVFLCILTIGCILMCFLHKRDGRVEDQPKEASISCFSYAVSLARSVVTPLLDVRILLIIPLFAYSGLQQAFVWSEFTKKIVKPAMGESGIGGSMAIYGAADAICSLVAGRLTSSVSSVTWIIVGGSSAHAIILLWILLTYSTASGVLGTVYPLLMAAALGIGDGVLMTQINALLGMLFKHDMEGAFAQLKVWQSLSIAVIFFLTPYISLHLMAAIMLTALCLALASFFILTLKVVKASSSHLSEA
ncbi:UNC93-like protein 3 [Amaranthus tricolor]|uniref:UNC93-like protein 3 n=1 Tax=Amaranthus tricolor TaxID=29722 RepID=UPI00258F4AEA|nr:UNC93-like protein 3 [Amaranthus tricolor]